MLFPKILMFATMNKNTKDCKNNIRIIYINET